MPSLCASVPGLDGRILVVEKMVEEKGLIWPLSHQAPMCERQKLPLLEVGWLNMFVLVPDLDLDRDIIKREILFKARQSLRLGMAHLFHTEKRDIKV